MATVKKKVINKKLAAFELAKHRTIIELLQHTYCPKCGSGSIGYSIPDNTYDCECGHKWKVKK